MERLDAASFIDWMSGVHRRTRALAEVVPPGRLEWSPAPGRFTPGDILRHIAATERWMWGENVQGRPSRYPGHGTELAEGKEDVLAYLDAMHAETVDIVGGLAPEDLRGKCATVGGVEITAWKWLRLMIEHEIHHRGQLYQMLGELDVDVPSLYGLTEPEVRARSEPQASATDPERQPNDED
ncbi:MAG: DinB family protein [Gemmatimonadota bacterium]